MADTNKLVKKMKSIVTSLRGLMECPICLETLRVPFKQCNTGHMVCKECLKNIQFCPTCNARFTIENPVGIKNLLEALPRFCHYSDRGCREVLEPRDDHELYCGFRMVTCQEKYCKQKLPVRMLKEHYNQKHPTTDICTKTESTIFIDLSYFDMNADNEKWFATFLSKTFLYIRFSNSVNEKSLKVNFLALPKEKLFNEYFLRVSSEKGAFHHASTIKANVITSNKAKANLVNHETFDAIEKSHTDNPEFCMKFPRSLVLKLKDKTDKLPVKLHFFEEGCSNYW